MRPDRFLAKRYDDERGIRRLMNLRKRMGNQELPDRGGEGVK